MLLFLQKRHWNKTLLWVIQYFLMQPIRIALLAPSYYLAHWTVLELFLELVYKLTKCSRQIQFHHHNTSDHSTWLHHIVYCLLYVHIIIRLWSRIWPLMFLRPIIAPNVIWWNLCDYKLPLALAYFRTLIKYCLVCNHW